MSAYKEAKSEVGFGLRALLVAPATQLGHSVKQETRLERLDVAHI